MERGGDVADIVREANDSGISTDEILDHIRRNGTDGLGQALRQKMDGRLGGGGNGGPKQPAGTAAADDDGPGRKVSDPDAFAKDLQKTMNPEGHEYGNCGTIAQRVADYLNTGKTDQLTPVSTDQVEEYEQEVAAEFLNRPGKSAQATIDSVRDRITGGESLELNIYDLKEGNLYHPLNDHAITLTASPDGKSVIGIDAQNGLTLPENEVVKLLESADATEIFTVGNRK